MVAIYWEMQRECSLGNHQDTVSTGRPCNHMCCHDLSLGWRDKEGEMDKRTGKCIASCML